MSVVQYISEPTNVTTATALVLASTTDALRQAGQKGRGEGAAVVLLSLIVVALVVAGAVYGARQTWKNQQEQRANDQPPQYQRETFTVSNFVVNPRSVDDGYVGIGESNTESVDYAVPMPLAQSEQEYVSVCPKNDPMYDMALEVGNATGIC